MKLTDEELRAEFDIAYHTRIGILLDNATDKPSREQIYMAFAEAERHLEQLKQAEL